MAIFEPPNSGLLAIGLLVVAPFVGSFLGATVMRLEKRAPLVLDRSRCDHCGHRLSWLDLIPLASWLGLRGRCRYCESDLSPFYPAIEVAAFAPVIWAMLVVPPAALIPSTLLGWLLLALAIIDMRSFRLPDILTGALFCTGLAITLVFYPSALVPHILGSLLGFGALALLAAGYRILRGRQGLGLGDAKLLGALGMWLGWTALPTIVLYGCVLALAFIVLQSLRGQLVTGSDRIPFGAFLSAGGWFVWLYGPLLLAR